MRTLVPALLLFSCVSPPSELDEPQSPGEQRLAAPAAASTPFTFIVGTTEIPVDRVTQVFDRYTLQASGAPGLTATLSGTQEPGFIRWTVESHQGALDGVTVRYDVSRDFDCHTGFADWAYEQHSCGGKHGTIASFCLTSACDNALVRPLDSAAGPPRIGAKLLATPARGLDGASFALYEDSAPYGSPASARALAAFFARIRPQRTKSSSWLISRPPPVPLEPTPVQWTEDAATVAAAYANSLRFDEVLLLDYQWAQSMGAWHERVPLKKINDVFTRSKVCPIAHTLVSLLDLDNPLCAPAPNQPPGTCPSNAWLRDANGNPIISPVNTYFWDSTKASIVDATASTYAQGLVESGSCGTYGDAADFFQTPGAAIDWAERFRVHAPNARLRMSVAQSALSLFTDETDITDQWQIHWSFTPADWAFNWGYHLMRGEWQHLGIAPRLGWVPPPVNARMQPSYTPMLSAAIATGSYVTIQMQGDDPALSNLRWQWFRDQLRDANTAIAEIRAHDAIAVTGPSDARHDVLHFSNGVSTVALFDQIAAPALPGGLEARSHGVRIDTGTRDCSPFASCFHFNGSLRYPPTYLGPVLDDPGSWLMLPPAQTSTSSVTMSVWFKPEGKSSGYLMEKGPLGYGVFLWLDPTGQLKVGGHLVGGPGAFLLHDYAPVTPDAWHHLVYAYDDATKRIQSWVDGTKFLDATATGRADALTSPYTPLWIGSTPGAGPFKGWMNDLRVYSRALSDAEVAALRGTQPDSVAKGLVSALSAETPAPAAAAVVDVALGEQRTAWLVPLVHAGGALPAETVRLTFDGPFRRVPQVEACAAAARPRVTLDGTLIVDVDATLLGDTPCRVHVP